MGKKCLTGLIFFVLLLPATMLNAQEKQTGKENQGMGMGMSSGSMQECMNQIASDSTMRHEMMTKMMTQMKGDTSGMRRMCSEMMRNPEMHEMMMKMMHEGESGMGGMMKGDMKHEMGDTTSVSKPRIP